MVKNNKNTQSLIKSLDKKWKKGTPTRDYVGSLMHLAHLDGELEGMKRTFKPFPYMFVMVYAMAACIGYMYGIAGESVLTIAANVALFSAIYLGVGYFFRRRFKDN